MRRFLAVGLAVFLLGCGGDDDDPVGPQGESLTGTWSGQAQSGTLRLTLNQASSNVTGNGNLTFSSGSIPLTATGTATAPDFALTLSSPGFASMNFTGTSSATALTGTINGSGFNNTAVTLTKE